MKTLEQLVEEYCNTKQLSYVERLVITKGFVDGYKAGCENTQTQLAVGEKTIRELLGKPQWISVKDKLPEFCESVLIRGECGIEEDGYRIQWIDSDKWTWQSGNYSAPEDVTHWMPIPESQKEQK